MQTQLDSDQQIAGQAIEQEPVANRSQWHVRLVEVLETLVLSLILFFVINMLTARVEIESESMQDTLIPGNRVVVNKLSYLMDLPQRGDIIVFNPPFDSPEPYIKRVIGLPGDEVTINKDGVFVSGVQLAEPYVDSDILIYGAGTWIVADGALFMMGDNRDNSSDSRIWGLMPVENVIGKAVFVYWPPSQWGALRNEN